MHLTEEDFWNLDSEMFNALCNRQQKRFGGGEKSNKPSPVVEESAAQRKAAWAAYKKAKALPKTIKRFR